MSAFDPVLALPLALVLLAVGIAATVAAARFARVRRRARRRVVEQPNSHYTSPLVLERETRHRWHNIRLERVHEINRGEAIRLIAKVEALGSEALRPDERNFLDRMVELAGTRPPAPPREKSQEPAPDLRHRPA